MWKDVLEGCFVLLLSIESYKLMETKNSFTLKNSITFIIASLLTILFRNNAIYMYIILIIVSFIVQKKQYKKLFVVFSIVLGVYFAITGPVFKYFNIEKSKSAEYIAIPMQQIGRMIYKGVDLNENEEKVINKILDIKIIKEVYNPGCFDPIKFNEEYNNQAFNKNKLEFFKVYIGLVIKHPLTAIESYAASTLGYWYPNTPNRVYETTIIKNNFGLEQQPIAPQILKQYVSIMGNQNNPIISLTYSIGLYAWTLILFGYLAIKRKNSKVLYAFVPTVGSYITIMLATPLYNEVRYIFCLFTTLPFLSVLVLMNNKKKLIANKKKKDNNYSSIKA